MTGVASLLNIIMSALFALGKDVELRKTIKRDSSLEPGFRPS